MTRLRFSSLLLALLPLQGSHATILMLSHDEASQRLRIVDEATLSAVALSSVGIGVQAGSVTADPIGHRVFFVSNSRAAQRIVSLGYAGGGVEQADVPAGLRVTHLEWDGSGLPRLLGVAIDTTVDATVLVQFQNGSLTSLGMILDDCCVFRTGVSAFRAVDDSLFLIGREDAELQDRIYRFTLGGPPAGSYALLDADLTVLELAVAPNGHLFGLARSTIDGNTRLVNFDSDLNATIVGTGAPDCCFALAGSSAIDPIDNTLVVLGSPIDGSNDASRLWRFGLTSGAVLDTATPVSTVGLFFDARSVQAGGDLFANGFESGPALPRP